ncbi:plasmid mobilization relaxosome protein MobC [Chitinophaga filiformis]|uniref:Plasmid mobilization relaxosome protein MobC n=1 Tax=Chitinophaga filiformis TaxID=104663 RepID=A0ABY4HYF1_CHIFI|nr:plasmid mobilization relaxosome protein MobC [Chitinophaga filiformis]UPK68039.1 plasmid mobilization relaxosome protein MobC [Chitinophaga filiformis]
MPRKKVPQQEALAYDVKTRINQYHFDRLQRLLASSRCKNMSGLLRIIICERPLTVYTKDDSLGTVMEELVKVRKEMNAIGVNINQLARQINAAPDHAGKLLHTLALPSLLQQVSATTQQLIPTIEALAEKWLQK